MESEIIASPYPFKNKKSRQYQTVGFFKKTYAFYRRPRFPFGRLFFLSDRIKPFPVANFTGFSFASDDGRAGVMPYSSSKIFASASTSRSVTLIKRSAKSFKSPIGIRNYNSFSEHTFRTRICSTDNQRHKISVPNVSVVAQKIFLHNNLNLIVINLI